MNYLLHLLIYFNIYAILAISLNMVVGYSGLLTLAHATFFAMGSYAYAISTVGYGWDQSLSLVAAVLIGAAGSMLVSLPSWRLTGDSFVMATLAVQALVFSMIYNWTDSSSALGSIRNLTNGPYGISGVPRLGILGSTLDSFPKMLVGVSLVASGCYGISYAILSSPWGRLCRAVRDDELAARGLGKSARWLRIQVFCVSGSMAAMAGALYASHVGYVDPSLASLDQSILLLSMVIVGGLSSIRGSLVGAGVLLAVPELLRLLQMPTAISAETRQLLYGAMLILFVHLRPQGLVGRYRYQ